MTQDFPAGLDRLWAVFGQPDYPRAKYAALGAAAVRVTRFEATAQAIEVELERDVPVQSSALPAWARSLMGAQQTLRHRTAWRRTGPGQATAELDISPVGLPVHAQAVGSLVQTQAGTTQMRLTWRVRSAVPVLGGRVERLFAGQIRDALAADHAFTLGYLRQTSPT